MKTSFWKISVLSLSLLTLVACGKKKNDDGVAVNGRDVRVTAGPSNLPSGQGGVARQATTITPMDQSFEESVKVLASATVQPEFIGTIKFVDFAGQVAVNPQNGMVLPGASSYVQIAIVDSNVGRDQSGNEIPPIIIRVPIATGQASNYNANMTFSDDYGSIIVTGTYDQQNFKGTVRFANKTGGFNNRKDGTLGSFVIPTCAFFVCN